MHEILRPAIFISGNGTSMYEIGLQCQPGGVLYHIVEPAVVVASKSGIPGIEKARSLGIPVEIIERNEFPYTEDGRKMFGDKLIGVLSKYNPDIINQNGWIPKTPAIITNYYKVFNQHPVSLDPDHKGPDNIPIDFGGQGMFGNNAFRALLLFQKLSGRIFPNEPSIHRVDPDKYDQGPVVARGEVIVYADDTVEKLSERTLKIEYALQVDFLGQLARTGIIYELHRETPLINDSEIDYWKQAMTTVRDDIKRRKN
jgi:folate-dependent phosphoribosylglycinamide formyltransferase PurN